MGSDKPITNEDDWFDKSRRNQKLSFCWIGVTTFTLKPHASCVATIEETFPRMPTMPATQEHGEKIGHHAPASMEEIMTLMAMVARPVGRKEIISNPDAQKALDVEWNKLMEKGYPESRKALTLHWLPEAMSSNQHLKAEGGTVNPKP